MALHPTFRSVLVASALLLAPPPAPVQAAPVGSGPGQSDDVVVVEGGGGAIPPPPPPTVIPVLLGQEEPVPPPNARPASQHSLYIEGITLVFTNSISVNYSYRPIRLFALSAGFGVSKLVFISQFDGVGGQVLGHLLLGRLGDHNFEICAGAAFVRTTFRFGSEKLADPALGVFPSAGLGYRYQPMDGGLLFRVGAEWAYGFAMGLQASIGVSF